MSGIVSWVSGLVSWAIGIVSWVSGIVSWVLGVAECPESPKHREFVNKSGACAASLDYEKFQAVIKPAASAASAVRPAGNVRCWRLQVPKTCISKN